MSTTQNGEGAAATPVVASPNPESNPSSSNGAGTFDNLTFDHWITLGDTIKTIKTTLDSANGKSSKATFTEINKGLETLEDGLSKIAKLHFDLYEEVKTLKSSLGIVSNKVAINEATGNLSTKVEDSVAYKNVCKEVLESCFISKVPNFTFESPMEGSKDIAAAARTKIKAQNIDLPNSIPVIALAKKTNVVRENNVAPLLLKCKTSADRQKLDRDLRGKGINVAFHWPKSVFDQIKNIREQVCKYKDNDLDLNGKEVLIRPNLSSAGETLNISYRAKGESKWTFLSSCQTPAPPSLLNTMNLPQPAKSKYFSI